MKKGYFILILILLALATSAAMGQGTAQATMKVSVRVVNGATIQVSQNKNVLLSNEQAFRLGSLTLKGIKPDQVLISIAKEIRASDSTDNLIDLQIKSVVDQSEPTGTNIGFEGSTPEQIKTGAIYEGDLVTTIQYI